MGIRRLVGNFTKPVEEIDRDKLRALTDALGVTHMDELEPRTRVRVAGEIRTVRIVPRAGAPSLEVTVADGYGHVVGVFFGRRKIAGLSPGRRVAFEGVADADDPWAHLYNPSYELLA